MNGIRTAKLTGNTLTGYLLDGGNVVAELEDDALSTSYLRGANLISRTTAATEYYTFNAHGDVVGLVNAAGTQTKTYAYDACGNEKDRIGADTNPFRYCGEYFDVESGIYYLRARYYDPSIGRFTQEDAACFGLNWYAYCGNNPIAFHDPTGFMPVCADEEFINEKPPAPIPKLTFVQKAITNRYLWNSAKHLTALLNIKRSMLFPEATSRNSNNRAAYSGLGQGEYPYITGQRLEAYRNLPYCGATLGEVGCELIAVYNVMVALGNPQPLVDIADYFDDYSSVLDGNWGTVLPLSKYFTAKGYSTRTIFCSDLSESYGEFDEHFKKADTAVFSFWWSADDVMQGVHTVCIIRNPGGGIEVYNFAGGSETESVYYGSIAEMIADKNILPICITMVW